MTIKLFEPRQDDGECDETHEGRGELVVPHCPRGPQPRKGAMLVLSQVSSRNNRRDEAIRP